MEPGLYLNAFLLEYDNVVAKSIVYLQLDGWLDVMKFLDLLACMIGNNRDNIRRQLKDLVVSILNDEKNMSKVIGYINDLLNSHVEQISKDGAAAIVNVDQILVVSNNLRSGFSFKFSQEGPYGITAWLSGLNWLLFRDTRNFGYQRDIDRSYGHTGSMDMRSMMELCAEFNARASYKEVTRIEESGCE